MCQFDTRRPGTKESEIDAARFDTLARAIGQRVTRRRLATAAAGAASLLPFLSAEAKKKKKPKCKAPKKLCKGKCVDVATDRNACGGCATRCRTGQTCHGGNCCDAGFGCGDGCCSFAGQCRQGTCCPGQRKACEDVCCPQGESCSGDGCCPELRACGDVCCDADEFCGDDGACAPLQYVFDRAIPMPGVRVDVVEGPRAVAVHPEDGTIFVAVFIDDGGPATFRFDANGENPQIFFAYTPAIAIAPDGSAFYAGGNGIEVYDFDLGPREPVGQDVVGGTWSALGVDAANTLYVGARDVIYAFDADGELADTWDIEDIGPPADIAAVDAGVYALIDFAVKRFDRATGEIEEEWGEYGEGHGEFQTLNSVAVTGDGRVLVSDLHRVQVFSGDGAFRSWFGGFGTGEGQFQFALGIAVDAAGKVYVADQGNHRVQVFRPA